MESQRGEASGGETFEPDELPEESAPPEGKPRSAPAPGLPMSHEEYEQMKDAARHRPAPRAEHAQEDKPRKEDK